MCEVTNLSMFDFQLHSRFLLESEEGIDVDQEE